MLQKIGDINFIDIMNGNGYVFNRIEKSENKFIKPKSFGFLYIRLISAQEISPKSIDKKPSSWYNIQV